jgi:hypothetical protein
MDSLDRRNRRIVTTAILLVVLSVLAFFADPYYRAGAVIVGGWSAFVLVFAAWVYWPRS